MTASLLTGGEGKDIIKCIKSPVSLSPLSFSLTSKNSTAASGRTLSVMNDR